MADARPAMGSRAEVLADLAARIGAVGVGAPQRVAVAIDGVDGAGKTVLADELAAVLAPRRHVVRVSIDGFHRPAAERYARGRGPDSFYLDSYDDGAFLRSVIDPFRSGRDVVPAVHDVAADRPVTPAPLEVTPTSVLLVDGIFLQRPELAAVWDAVLFVDVPFTVSVPRGNGRFPGEHDDDPEAESNRRYVEGQRRYLRECDPRGRATWVLDNTDLSRPVVVHG
ncbi:MULTISPECIES: uridine kinase [unclassified Janibacter]|uniref:uridine kinase n=1 Tax=unclassified Janibacter TaxID=2649294 RepID=UPI003CFE8438